MSTRYQVIHSEPLSGDLDVATLVHEMPSACLVKGLFFSEHVRFLGDRFLELEAELREPPKLHRYIPFSFYPLADFLFLFDKAARSHYPHLPGREAHRQHARGEFEAFSQSTLGRVTMALLSDARSALLEYPRSFNAVAKGLTIHGEERGPHAIELRYDPYFGSREHAIGLVEQIVTYFGGTPHLTVNEVSPSSFTIDVHWFENSPRVP